MAPVTDPGDWVEDVNDGWSLLLVSDSEDEVAKVSPLDEEFVAPPPLFLTSDPGD